MHGSMRHIQTLNPSLGVAFASLGVAFAIVTAGQQVHVFVLLMLPLLLLAADDCC